MLVSHWFPYQMPLGGRWTEGFSVLWRRLQCCHLAGIVEGNKHPQRAIHPICLQQLLQDDRTCSGRSPFLSWLQRTQCDQLSAFRRHPHCACCLQPGQVTLTLCVIYNMDHAVWIEHNAILLLRGQNETEVGKEARLLPSPLGSQPWSGDLARKPRCTRAGKYLSACATLLRKAREMLVWAAATPSLARQVSGSCPRDRRLCFHHCTSMVCIDKGSKLLHAEESRKKLCWLYKNHHIPQLPPNYFLLIGLLLTVFSPQNTVDIYILLRHLLAKIIERRDVRCKTMPSIRETSH